MVVSSTMWLDVVELRDFYASGLGQMTRRLIRRRVRQMWPDVTGMRVLGVGFPTPFLRPFEAEAERVVAVMPASQGVLHWPPQSAGKVVLSEDTVLPFPDRLFDRVLLVHSLEQSEHSRALMREVWRVLADGGRLIVVTPNRQGLWARLERTPFASGRPYSRTQLRTMLRDTMFTPLTTEGALFVPPFHSRLLLPWAKAIDEVGARWFPGVAGVVMVEAAKQIYAVPPEGARVRKRYLPIPENLLTGGVRPPTVAGHRRHRAGQSADS